MEPIRLWSADERTTKAIGAALAGLLGPGDVVGLAGDLGAGKTRLVQGAADALGTDGPVLSPTFMLVREYDGDPPVHHVDAYRLSGPLELEDLGLEDVLSADAVVFVEWADRVAAALPESWLELVLHIPTTTTTARSRSPPTATPGRPGARPWPPPSTRSPASPAPREGAGAGGRPAPPRSRTGPPRPPPGAR